MSRARHNEPEEQWVDANGVWSPRRRLKTKSKPIVPQEKRQFERIAVDRRATGVELDPFGAPGAPFECTIQNLSRGGLGLCATRMIHLDRRLFIEVEDAEGKFRLLFGMVRQVRYVEGQGYIFGIQFEPLPTTGPAAAWMSKRRSRPAGTSRRTAA